MTIDYFISKFEKIPLHKWTKKWCFNEHGQNCVLGHCGVKGPWDIENNIEAIY
jgi:hypothetical protein